MKWAMMRRNNAMAGVGDGNRLAITNVNRWKQAFIKNGYKNIMKMKWAMMRRNNAMAGVGDENRLAITNVNRWKQTFIKNELPRCTCHAADDFKKHNQLMKLMQFLIGLDDIYMQIGNSILLRENLPDVKSAYAIIFSQESHRIATNSVSGTSQRSQTSTFNVNVPNREDFQRSQTSTSFSRPSNNNRPNDNGNRRTAGGSTLVCENYGFNGHSIDKCFKIIGYPANFGKRKASSNFKGKNVSNNDVGSSSYNGFSDKQMPTLISLIKENFVNGKGVHSNMEGANQHITYTDKYLIDVIDISYLKIKVTHPNRMKAFITRIGNKPLTDYLTLYDVLVVPAYCVSLISVHKVARDSLKSVFLLDIQILRKGILWSLDNKQIIYSRDVKFFKDIFPFKQNNLTGIDNSFQDVNHLNFFNTNTLDDLPEIPNDEERRNPSPIRHANSPYHSSSTSAFLNENDAGHSQDADVFASENASLQPMRRIIVIIRVMIYMINLKIMSLKIMLFKITMNGWSLFQMNISNAFLYGELEETVYMTLPPGYFPDNETTLCKLNKSLYDLNLFTKSFGDVFIALLVYVDDIIITGKSLIEIEKGICLNQRKYCLELIDEFGLLVGKPSNFPMQPNISLTSEPSDIDPLLDNVTEYQKLIGKLIYLATTRPDITYTVSCLSQLMHNPLKSHLKTALKHNLIGPILTTLWCRSSSSRALDSAADKEEPVRRGPEAGASGSTLRRSSQNCIDCVCEDHVESCSGVQFMNGFGDGAWKLTNGFGILGRVGI
nr:ribonuclease H-like domain-containing protein [Tanacetum cinerariifolium]